MSPQAFSRGVIAKITFSDDSSREFAGGDPYFRITFSAHKTIGRRPNPVDVTIYNLNENSRKKIETEGINIEIYAGYMGEGGILSDLTTMKQNLFLACYGDIDFVTSRKEGTEWVTSISCRDAGRLESLFINKSWGPNTEIINPIEDIIKKLVETFKNKSIAKMFLDAYKASKKAAQKVSKEIGKEKTEEGEPTSMAKMLGAALAKDAEGSVWDGVEKTGRAIAGKAMDAMNKLTDKIGADFSVQDNEILISLKNQAIPPSNPNKIWSLSNGLIVRPQRTEISTDGNKMVPGIIFKTLILRDIVPHYSIKIEGFPDHKIIEARMQGDTHSDISYIDATAIEIGSI